MENQGSYRSIATAIFPALALAIMLAGCGTQPVEQPPVTEAAPSVEPSASPEPELTDEQKSFLETLVIALPKSPTTLAPASSVGESTFVVTGNTYDHLIEYAPGGSEIGPSLATEWDVSDDGMAYVFRLRDDVKFHDGTMLDAEAVKFGFGRAPGMERRTSLLVRNYPPKRVNSIYGESR